MLIYAFLAGRPESSLTVGSDCSSTISTDEEEEGVTISPSPVPSSPHHHTSTPKNSADTGEIIDVDLSSGTIKISLPSADDRLLAGNNVCEGGSVPAKDQQAKLKDQATTSSTLSPATKNRLANLFKKIPKFKQPARAASATAVTPLVVEEPKTPSMSRRGTMVETSKTPSTPRTPSMTRTRSASSENGFNRNTSERSSYRAPKGTSRYMQAAEAYKHKASNAGINANNSSISSGTSTWSAASTTRSRPRASITSDTFTTPLVRAPRTASASPAVHRKRINSLSSRDKPMTTKSTNSSHNSSYTNSYVPSSTHSTPSRKPMKRSQSRDYYNGGSGANATLPGEPAETDEMILKRMEEILFTYKSKVEGRLAAEGKELPKDLFNDFTEHWLNSTPQRCKSIDTLSENSSRTSDRCSSAGGKTPVLPKERKESREGCSSTRIPKPIFYKNSIS